MQSTPQAQLPILWWVKLALILMTLVFGISFTIPTFMGDPSSWSHKVVTNKDGEESKVFDAWYHKVAGALSPDSRIALGLDLKGGLHLVLEVDVVQSLKDSIARALNRARDLAHEKGLSSHALIVNNDYSVTLEINDINNKDEFVKIAKDQTSLVLFDRTEGNTLYFVGASNRIEEYTRQILGQAMSTVRNRIDQFGVVEPSLFQQGGKRIVVQMPGVLDAKRAKELIGNTAQLDFRRVLGDIPSEKFEGLLEEGKKALLILESDTSVESVSRVSQWLRDNNKIPLHATFLLQRQYVTESGTTKLLSSRPYLVEAQPRLTGEMLERAEAASVSQYVPDYGVHLTFNPPGAKVFGEITTEAHKPQNAPHQIAIVLDGNINSAPEVREPILGGTAQITLGRSGVSAESKWKQAQDLALVLRAGALPASVKIVEERQIGPSEGEENIRSGVLASAIAGGLVAVLMLAIYGRSGLVANIAMVFNVLLILAFLAAFGATLTLPGIAGIVLTMAVAVDGNVIINERIREELRLGYTHKQAFYHGYQASFTTLVDAHVTSAVAGVVLLIYGNPAVKGFAVTLLTGIVSTLFTSYYVTEVIGQFLVEKTRWKRFA